MTKESLLGCGNRAVATRCDLLCRVHGPSFPQVNFKEPVRGAALSCMSGDLIVCRKCPAGGKMPEIHFYDDQEPGSNASLNSFSVQSLHLLAHLLAPLLHW
jgi:hypothetical protein